MCCGQKRSELQSSQAQTTARSVDHYTFANSQTQPIRSQASRTGSSFLPVSTNVGSVHAPVPTPAPLAQSSISIRYLENSPIRARGLVSGRYYEFSGSHPVQPVDARDASSLLNTRFFRRA